ncbi:MAG: Gfo/Idh/MocA family oxidoreductase [bacterium]|nr:Gfo/Idh/MocA family oxidoreductase [bacterium]
MKFGIIGCSRVAQKGMIPAICGSSIAELAMIGSRDKEKAKETASRFHCGTFGTYEDVINNKDIDVVYVSLPNSMHEEWSIKAANAGKHVICEKPAAISYASARKMVQAAKDNNVRLLEGYMFRYHPQHAKVKSLIREGVLGELVRFEGVLGYPMPEKGSTMMQKELAGGSLQGSAGYPVSASRMIFEEEPISIFCRLEIDPESGVDVKTDILLEYSNKKSAFASSIFGSYFQSTYNVLGTKACVKMGRAYAVPRDMGTKIFLDIDDKVEETVIEPADHFRIMLDDFCGEILKGAKSVKKYEDELLAQARVLEAARLSDKEKRIVKISEIQ